MKEIWLLIGDAFATVGRKAYSVADYFWAKGDAF